MLQPLADIIDYHRIPLYDPKKIPAIISLEHFGAMRPIFQDVNGLTGEITDVIADDPERTVYFIPNPDQNYTTAVPPEPQPVKRSLAAFCATAAALGASLLTTGVICGSWLLATAGLGLLVLAVYCLVPEKPQLVQWPPECLPTHQSPRRTLWSRA